MAYIHWRTAFVHLRSLSYFTYFRHYIMIFGCGYFILFKFGYAFCLSCSEYSYLYFKKVTYNRILSSLWIIHISCAWSYM